MLNNWRVYFREIPMAGQMTNRVTEAFGPMPKFFELKGELG